MRRRAFVVSSLVGIPLAATGYWLWPRTNPPAIANQISDQEFASIRKAVRPAAGEDLFAEIPWEVSLWDARRKAAARGLPILLWEMDGHPLGCG